MIRSTCPQPRPSDAPRAPRPPSGSCASLLPQRWTRPRCATSSSSCKAASGLRWARRRRRRRRRRTQRPPTRATLCPHRASGPHQGRRHASRRVRPSGSRQGRPRSRPRRPRAPRPPPRASRARPRLGLPLPPRRWLRLLRRELRSPSRAIALARVCVWNLSVYGGAPDDVEEKAGYTNRMRHGGRGETRKRAGECLNNQRTACNTKPSAADSASLQPVCHEAVQSVSRKSGPGTDSPRRPRPTTSQHIVTSRCAHAFRQSHLEAFWSVA